MLRGKNSIITGANRGIGAATVEAFAKNGSNIWACARRPDEAFEQGLALLSKQYSVWIKPVYFDMASEESVKEGVKQIRADKQPVNALANIAGATYNALFQMTSVEKMKEMFQINYFSPFLFTQYVVKMMLRNGGGSIVNISSSAALDGNAGRSAYGASKAAVMTMTASIAEELGSQGIRANAIAPGIINTKMARESMTAEVIEDTAERSCLGRIGTPEEIASLVVFLASDKASYITGQIIRADGGMY